MRKKMKLVKNADNAVCSLNSEYYEDWICVQYGITKNS